MGNYEPTISFTPYLLLILTCGGFSSSRGHLFIHGLQYHFSSTLAPHQFIFTIHLLEIQGNWVVVACSEVFNVDIGKVQPRVSHFLFPLIRGREFKWWVRYKDQIQFCPIAVTTVQQSITTVPVCSASALKSLIPQAAQELPIWLPA